ncbi:MAG: class I SAM-dependent DNA methyltransferase, partial [Duodenibacillus sp.]
ARGIRQALKDLFEVLNTPIEERDDYLEEDLAAFPYVAGGLFSDNNIEIPRITDEIRTLILSKASEEFDWSKISPTIFGAVFESTLNPVTRRAGGMHYTSVENIHKVIGPLFLNDLRAELDRILALQVSGVRDKQLKAFQDKLAGLRFLDPACGSGNFLTETYIQLRRLENEALRVLSRGQALLGLDEMDPVKVKINQFYGIEINDFAVTVATAALWIAESQMLHETEDIINRDIDFLPLKSNSNIHEGNALRGDWSTVIDPSDLSYIMGNPPFIGSYLMNAEQKKEITDLYGGRLCASLDYVAGWYLKAAQFMKGHSIDAAFVSTNSITQGEQVAPMWSPLLDMGIYLSFAHRTFRWDSEAADKANIFCVIIGFTYRIPKTCELYTYETVKSNPVRTTVSRLSPYLRDEEPIVVWSEGSPLFTKHKITTGNKPSDGGNFILSPEEKEAIEKQTPEMAPYLRWYLGAVDFIHSREPVRYCLWVRDAPSSVLAKNKEVMRRLEAVAAFRAASTAAPTRAKAETPREFFSNPQKDRPFLVIPRQSSETRRYIPMGFIPKEVIASDAVSIIPEADLLLFGLMSSSAHMAWTRAVAGRLKADYRYSGAIVFNPFPWPKCTPEQQAAI